MFRPLTERLHRGSSGLQTGELDTQTVARSFGISYSPNEPLPETDASLVHTGIDHDLPIDTRAVRPTPAPSLLSIVSTRLQSVPGTPERQREAMEWLGRLLEPLKELDAFVERLEAEHFEGIERRWEEIRQRGRELADSLPALQAELGAAQSWCNQSNEAKAQRRADLEQLVLERRHVSQWATDAEVQAADRRVEKAKEAAASAGATAFEAQQTLAAAESKMASAKENLRLHALELRRLEATLLGEPFFDPQLGLSTDPLTFQDPAQTQRTTDALDRHYQVRQ